MGRLRTPRALALLLPLVLLLALSAYGAWSGTAALGRLPRTAYLIGFGVPLSAALPLSVALWRQLFPLGWLARAPAWAVVGVALAATPAACTWPLPWFFFEVIDPIGNRAELAVIRRGLTPLVEDLKKTPRGAQASIAPLLDRHFASVPGFFRPVGAGNGGDAVRYYRQAERFAVAVWGTPPQRDDTTLVVYTSWDDRWSWRDKWDSDGRPWLGLGSVELAEHCYPRGRTEPPWECHPVERP